MTCQREIIKQKSTTKRWLQVPITLSDNGVLKIQNTLPTNRQKNIKKKGTTGMTKEDLVVSPLTSPAPATPPPLQC